MFVIFVVSFSLMFIIFFQSPLPNFLFETPSPSRGRETVPRVFLQLSFFPPYFPPPRIGTLCSTMRFLCCVSFGNWVRCQFASHFSNHRRCSFHFSAIPAPTSSAFSDHPNGFTFRPFFSHALFLGCPLS